MSLETKAIFHTVLDNTDIPTISIIGIANAFTAIELIDLCANCCVNAYAEYAQFFNSVFVN